MSGISTGAYAIVYADTQAQFTYAQRYSINTAVVGTLSADSLVANKLYISGDTFNVGVSTAPVTIKARTITVGGPSSTVVIPNETKLVSQTNFYIPDPNIAFNYGNVAGIVSAGLTVLSGTSASQPAYMNIQSSLGWVLSCPTNRAKATQFTANTLLQTPVFQAVNATLSTASLHTTSGLTISKLSVAQANLYNMSVPYISFPNIAVLSTASIGVLSATTVNASQISFTGTLQLSTTLLSANAISYLSATNMYATTILANDLYNTTTTTKPNDVHVNTVGSVQHLRILSPVFVSDTVYATNTSILVGALSTTTLNVASAATIVQLSVAVFNVSNANTSFTPYAINILNIVGDTNSNVGIYGPPITMLGTISVQSNLLAGRVSLLGTVTCASQAGGSTAAVNYIYVSNTLTVPNQNTIGSMSVTNLSVLAGVLSTQSLDVTNMSVSGTANMTHFYTTNLSIASALTIVGTLSVAERVSTASAVLGSTIEFKTTPVTPGLRMEYGTAITTTDGYCTVTFTQPFGTAPTVHAQALQTSTAFVCAVLTTAPTTTGVANIRTYADHIATSGISVHWFAVGM